MKEQEKLPIKIYIDTTIRENRIVKLYKDEQAIGEVSGEIDVVSSIRDLLEKNNLKIEQVSSFDMNPGPGSFTGLKAGAAIVNILNWAVGNKPSSEIILPEYGESKFDSMGKA